MVTKKKIGKWKIYIHKFWNGTMRGWQITIAKKVGYKKQNEKQKGE